MMSVDVKLLGFESLREILKETPDQLKIKALRPSVVEATRIAQGYAISAAPYRTGAIRRNLKVISRRGNWPWIEKAGLRVRALRRKAWNRMTEEQRVAAAANNPYYWFFQEFGWTDRAGKRHEGKAFMRDALDKHVQEHVKGFRDAYYTRMVQVVRRMHAKQRARMKAASR